MQEPTNSFEEDYPSLLVDGLISGSIETRATLLPQSLGKDLRKISVSLLLLVFLQLVFGLSDNTTSLLAVQPNVILGPEVVLLSSGKDEPAQILPPSSFSRQAAGLSTANMTVTYSGFTPKAQAAFQYAVNIWAALISSPVEIKIAASFEPLSPASVLASTRPFAFYRDFPNVPLSGVLYPVALANKFAGYDLDTTNPDIVVRLNSSFPNWYYEIGGLMPNGKTDFISAVLHELCHGLGFSSSMNVVQGSGTWGLYPYSYDRFIVNSFSQSLLDTGLFPNPSLTLAAQLTSQDLFFNGPNAKSVNGGVPPKLYAPSLFSQSFSISHLDESYNGTPNALMTYSLGSAESIHYPGSLALAILNDIGWGLILTAPSNLVVTSVTNTQVNLAWDDNSTDETGFVVERQDVTAKTGWVTVGTLVAHVGTGLINYSDSVGLSGGRIYSYQVRTTTFSGNSAPSNIVQVVIPGGCQVTSGNDSGTATLREVLGNPACTTITFPAPITINLTSPTPLLQLYPGVIVGGICGPTGPEVVINGSGVSGNGLRLGGNNTLFGVKVAGFSGSQILSFNQGNKMVCVVTSRL
ncbi:MAG: hypothetical protein WCS37_05995 [Chloroflexota bacterium]|nr:fibronectin type III domain-containing protein [Chloroflexota bacterium]